MAEVLTTAETLSRAQKAAEATRTQEDARAAAADSQAVSSGLAARQRIDINAANTFAKAIKTAGFQLLISNQHASLQQSQARAQEPHDVRADVKGASDFV